jgi:hypothetical protein
VPLTTSAAPGECGIPRKGPKHDELQRELRGGGIEVFRRGRRLIPALLGRVLLVAARFTPGDAGRDLRHLAEELVRLDQRRPASRATSR